MQNFGKIKNAFNGILVEGVVSKNDKHKDLFKKYIKTIKESEILKTQFLVYNNIENKVEKDSLSANIFVSENIKLLEKFSASEIIKENKKLLALSKDLSAKLEEDYDSKLVGLHESLSKLIFTKRTAKNVDSITTEIKNIVEYISSNKQKSVNETIELPNSMLTTIMVDKYNEKYSNLDETEKSVLKALIDSDDVKKKEVYAATVRECIDLIDEKLKESDLNAKDKLLRVKDKLLSDKQEIGEEFNKNISKLVELRASLKDN